jgi:two-component system, NtrC family, nitrogen regulation response regulator NtrX
MEPVLLIVRSEAQPRSQTAWAFRPEWRVLEAASAAEARAALSGQRPDVILLDETAAGASPLEFLRELSQEPAGPAIIVLTAEASDAQVEEASRHGAYACLPRGASLEELRVLVRRAMERQALLHELMELRQRLSSNGDFGLMLGSSLSMRNLFQTAQRVAQTDLAVLIVGEPGVGKDSLAREIHLRSRRAAQPWVRVNCTALPEHLLGPELLGGVGGVSASKRGSLEQAHGGTLFLEEVADMPPAAQEKLLVSLSSAGTSPLHEPSGSPFNVRLISSANRELQPVLDAEFSRALFERLSQVILYIPPLRERREDIPALAEVFWQELRAKYARPGPKLGRETILTLQGESWPGNTRELRNTLERLFLLARGDEATAEDLAACLSPMPTPPRSPLEAMFSNGDYREARRRFEIEYITRKLHQYGGNVTRTAAAIGMARQSLQEKIRDLGILR